MRNARRIALATLALAAALPLGALAQTQASTCTAKGNSMKVKLTTTLGDIVIELNREKAPISTDNFVKYVQSGHYNGTVFHRVIKDFMIQGGGFTKDGKQKPTQPAIKNESTNGLKNENYTVAMARTGVRDSATSQFFINTKNNDFLDYSGESPTSWGYAVIGKVVEGKDVVDKIKAVPVQRTSVSEAQPLTPVVIEKAECV